MVILSTHIVEDVRELCSQMAIIDRGKVLMTGDPRSLTSQLSGKIWQKVVSKEEVDGYCKAMSVISTRLFAGSPMIRVCSDTSPGDGFDPVNPDLEDAYFTALRQADSMSAN